MDIGAILIGFALLILVVLYIARPFISHRATRFQAGEYTLSSLLAEKERILDALVELEFDFKLGKVPESIYQEQRKSLVQRGAEILRQIDEHAPKSIAKNDLQPISKNMQGTPVTSDDLENMIADRRKARTEARTNFCPQCGQSVTASDRFCANCGTQI
jgi:hypothetical protein